MARRKNSVRSTGRIDKSAPTFEQREQRHVQNISAELAAAEQDIAQINTVYEVYRAQYMRLKIANPHSPRLPGLNLVVNNLALALNGYAKECVKIKQSRRHFC